jgi:hypothetical protein
MTMLDGVILLFSSRYGKKAFASATMPMKLVSNSSFTASIVKVSGLATSHLLCIPALRNKQSMSGEALRTLEWCQKKDGVAQNWSPTLPQILVHSAMPQHRKQFLWPCWIRVFG